MLSEKPLAKWRIVRKRCIYARKMESTFVVTVVRVVSSRFSG